MDDYHLNHKGDKLFDLEKQAVEELEKAIEHYGKAWDHAQKAVKKI